MGKIKLNPGTMLNPVPVVLVSCGRGEEANLITIAWTGTVNSEPPYTYVSVRKDRHSHGILSKEKEFVINLTTKDLLYATDFCGVKSGASVDKFREAGLTKEPSSIVGCPMVAESPVSLECKVRSVHEFPTHDMFLAEIVAVQVREELMDKSGKLRLDKAGLICFNHGEYMAVGEEVLGGFGFSVMKPSTKKRKQQEAKNKK
ncbi:MAG: flavin reductase family protein [Bacillota bacterium]|jgi:flavin reductase (DIM6/NTAB) family NADH-FMN oxidoreductase RutF|nr:flavin reductase family protein [Eubacteriales bacterium]MDI9491711.1 flavin reductase family protein [Bacillota bacterium]NLV69421.1 flavin reductase family protein [Clostridiales bacterium]MDD3537241.1 flavin reductase family protein [Eubacteriales bacterium]MDD4285927.1 flavin reductase family protein [Eubacteriales bacterium]